MLLATTMLASALLHAPATTVRAPSPLMVSGLFNRRSPAPPPLPPPPPPVAPAEQAALRAAAGAWLASTPFALSSARGIVTDVFGLPTSTFEDNLREPAAGLLEITAPLFPLEATTLYLLFEFDVHAFRRFFPSSFENRGRTFQYPESATRPIEQALLGGLY